MLNLKKMKNFILKSVTFSIILSLSLLWTYFVIQARNSSSSWLTVDSSNPASLYVGNNETLTSAKRNRLVKNAVREEVPTTDTAPFDNKCDRKWDAGLYTYYATNVLNNGTSISYSFMYWYVYILNTLKSTVYSWPSYTSAWTFQSNPSHIRKKCN